jgi:Trypsin-like peptidase domain/AAA ATPase domain
MPESIDTSLVRIHTKAGGVAGAGFLVGERHMLTCAHVIAQALGLADDAPDPLSSTVSLDFPQLASHTLLTAEVVFYLPVQADGRGDIASLKLLDEPPIRAEAVHFATAEQVWEHPYRAFGFPAGQDDGVWSDGRLLGRQGTNCIQLEDDKIPGFAVISGFSGAPVWDEQLQGVVGMIVASIQPATVKAAFAIPSDVLLAAWPQLASLMRPSVPRNPYKGLHAFTEYDARDFFGRDTLIDELATAVETALTREYKEGQQARMLTVVLGPSGSGKSSVVMAGLLPCLRDGRVLNSKEWVYLDPVFPGAHPLETLAVSLAKQLPARGPVSLPEDLASASARNLHLLVCQLVASPQQKVVLMVDQFEEVFTLTTDEAERQHFFELLVTAVTEPSGPLFVILTLRADFYDRPMQYPELFRLIDDHHVSVLPLERGATDLREWAG